MSRIGIAFRLFFRALGNRQFAEQGARLLEGAAQPTSVIGAPRGDGRRSEAVTLLSVLQREARLVDFLQEDISTFDDAKVGAAVRDVHRDAGAVLDRIFSLGPVMKEPEGTAVKVPAGADAARVRLTGNVTGNPPFRGTLRHHGWRVREVKLPELGPQRVITSPDVMLLLVIGASRSAPRPPGWRAG